MTAPAPAPAPSGGNDVGTYVLLGVVLLGIYLLYRSLQNIGSTISGVGSTAGGIASGVASTAGAELSNLLALPSAAYNGLGSLGTSLFNSGSTAGGYLSSDLGSFSLFQPDASVTSPNIDLGNGLSLGMGGTTADDALGTSLLGNSLLTGGGLDLSPIPSSTYVNGDGNLPSSNSGGSLFGPDSSPGSASSTDSGDYDLGSP